jgi:hypothetical protein
MLYLSRVQLKDVRCFENLDITLSKLGEAVGWTLVVGDNATGKSTLLRSIAMGLCDEASAAGLLKESDEGYIRRGASKARIIIWLHDTRSPSKKYRITTEVIRKELTRRIFADRVKQKTSPTDGRFPWDELFVSGYGAGRGVTGTGDISSYSAIDAVYNMFNYTEGLQNPELVIRRLIARDLGEPMLERQLFRILAKATGAENFRLTSNGIRVDGPWGQGMALRDLADGYKSSVLWITDLIGWALTFRPRSKTTKSIRGIVIVDELEQHLHARWQRTVVDDLRQLFPEVQFITSTHSPLIGSSVGPRLGSPNTDRLFVLESTEKEGVKASLHEFMRGWSMDQVLAPRAFKYQIQADPETERMLRIASALAEADQRTPDEERVFQEVKNKLKHAFLEGASPIERRAEIEADEQLKREVKQLENKVFEDED